jgi:hypothetical protein
MKARLVLEQFVNPKTLPAYLHGQILNRFGKDHTGKVVAIPYLPAGTIFEGEQAALMCRTGQCSPADDECSVAAGLSDDQIAKQQIEYKMNTLGINNENDRELYRAGVITGYDKDLKPIPEPNWNAYQAAKAESEAEEI